MKGIKGFQKGKNNPSVLMGPWNYGKKTPESVIKKLRESHTGYVMPESQKKKISKATTGLRKSKEFIDRVSGKNHHNWKGGKSFQLYGPNWTKVLKHSIRVRDRFVCQLCKKNGWAVHHIDYNKFNHNPNNLITLCRSCHGKTNFHRESWIEHFKKI